VLIGPYTFLYAWRILDGQPFETRLQALGQQYGELSRGSTGRGGNSS
jgi:hypothetical protein